MILLNLRIFILITVKSASNSSFSYEKTGAGANSDNGLDIFRIVTTKLGDVVSSLEFIDFFKDAVKFSMDGSVFRGITKR